MTTRAGEGRHRSPPAGPGRPSRTVGAVSAVDRLEPGDHVCWAVSSDEEHRSVLTDYFAAGLRSGDRLAYFSVRYPPEVILGYVRDAGFSPEDLVASGQLVVLDARAAYTPGGTFDESRMLETFGAEAERACRDGFRALRAAGESEWLLRDVVGLAELTAYEMRCDAIAASAPLIGLCSYDTRYSDPADVATVAAVHAGRLGALGNAFCVHASPGGGVTVDGEVDLLEEDRFRAALAAALAVAGDPAVLDLSGLRFIDVRGMGAIAALSHAGRPVCITNAPVLFRRCFELLELDGVPNLVLN